MHDLAQLVIAHLRGMWNRRWIGLAVAWLAAIVGITWALRVPDRYEANARVYVDTQSLLRPVMAGLSIQPSLDQQAALVSRTLISRPNVEKMVNTGKVDLGAKSSADRDDAIESILRGLQLNGDPKSNTYTISYRDPDPEYAKSVVQSLLNTFVESSLGDKKQDTRSALQFVDEQIKRYEQSLQLAEGRLKDFKLKYMGLAGQTGTAGQDFFGRMSKLSDEIANARLELSAAIQSRDAYRRGLASESSTVPLERTAGGTVVQPLEIDLRLAAQKAKLDELLRNYTDQHPDVVGTRRVIIELEEQRRQELRARDRVAAATGKVIEPTQQNPVFQKMRVSLADAEANVASLSAKLASYEGQYAQLKASARLVPQVEAEFAQLNRDYDIQKKTYGDLLARREAATMGADVQDTEAAQFRVIDPPRVSMQPVPPSRIVLLAAAFAAALGAGLVASFAANEIMPTFHDAFTLREISDRPLLGTLSLLPSESVRRRKRRNFLLFLGSLSGLIASFAGILALALLLGRTA
jgi:polysaccharide chain length determinant protein (PEP-CTERM system associated)